MGTAMLRHMLVAMLMAVAVLGCAKSKPYSDLDNTSWFDEAKGNVLEFKDDGTVTMTSKKTGFSQTYDYIRVEDKGLRIYKTGTRETEKPLFILVHPNPNKLADLHYGLEFIRKNTK